MFHILRGWKILLARLLKLKSTLTEINWHKIQAYCYILVNYGASIYCAFAVACCRDVLQRHIDSQIASQDLLMRLNMSGHNFIFSECTAILEFWVSTRAPPSEVLLQESMIGFFFILGIFFILKMPGYWCPMNITRRNRSRWSLLWIRGSPSPDQYQKISLISGLSIWDRLCGKLFTHYSPELQYGFLNSILDIGISGQVWQLGYSRQVFFFFLTPHH